MRYGYGRVSTRDQNPDAQHDALTAADCERLFIDKASGKLASRSHLDRMLDRLRPGDSVTITKLDRLGRSLANLLDLAAGFRDGGVELVILDQGIDTARARGRTGGQKPKLGPRQIKLAREMYEEVSPDGKRKFTVQQIADEFGVTRPTIYRNLQKGAAE